MAAQVLHKPGARSSSAFGIVSETLRQLGHPAADPDDEPDAERAAARA